MVKSKCSDYALYWYPSCKIVRFKILSETPPTSGFQLTTEMCITLSHRRLCEPCAWKPHTLWWKFVIIMIIIITAFSEAPFPGSYKAPICS